MGALQVGSAMRILHINTYDIGGGAARAAYRLHTGLRCLGHMSHLLVGQQTTHEPGMSSIAGQAAPFRTLRDKVLDRIGPRLERRFGLDHWSRRNCWHILKMPVFRQADVVNPHNFRGNHINIRILPDLAARKPVVWTLHDMWAFTGHCAYAYDCERWRTGCFDCPLLKEPGRQIVEPGPTPTDRTRQVWQTKRNLYRRISLHVVTPSQWLRRLVENSILAHAATIECIPNGVDITTFRPLEKDLARQALDLPLDARIVLFATQHTTAGRKGFGYLLKALGRTPDTSSIYLLTMGSKGALGDHAERFRTRELGYLSDEISLRLAYSATDVFVFPTLADNQPLVLIEAMACGIPVVSFDVGGVPEMVRHLQTGYLARYKDVTDLAHGIQLLLNDADLRVRLGRYCRKVAEEEYSLELQVRRYLQAYERAIEDHLCHSSKRKSQ